MTTSVDLHYDAEKIEGQLTLLLARRKIMDNHIKS